MIKQYKTKELITEEYRNIFEYKLKSGYPEKLARLIAWQYIKDVYSVFLSNKELNKIQKLLKNVKLEQKITKVLPKICR
jgi:hypothetical protein